MPFSTNPTRLRLHQLNNLAAFMIYVPEKGSAVAGPRVKAAFNDVLLCHLFCSGIHFFFLMMIRFSHIDLVLKQLAGNFWRFH